MDMTKLLTVLVIGVVLGASPGAAQTAQQKTLYHEAYDETGCRNADGQEPGRVLCEELHSRAPEAEDGCKTRCQGQVRNLRPRHTGASGYTPRSDSSQTL